MISVIIAGGSGTRLWPLSTPDYPKHLLKVNGGERTLLQNTYDRVKSISSAVYVIPEKSHAHHVKQQLPELAEDAFIIEPARRGTANCVAAALAYLTDKVDPKEAIAFVAADHYIRDVAGFEHSFRIAAEASEQQGRIVLVGVEPDYPSTGLGYIHKGELFDEAAFVFNVHSFTEKPEFNVARKFVKSGQYLWNCGYFVGSIETFKQTMEKYGPEMYAAYEKLLAAKSPAEYEKVYLTLKSDAIDYALNEKVDNLLVVPATFDWMDLGSFNDLHKAVVSNEQGNYTSGEGIELEGVENSFIQNKCERPVAVIGLDNVVVINTDNGVLVARKDLSQKVGDVSKRFHSKS